MEKKINGKRVKIGLRRAAYWICITLYTLILPEVIQIYHATANYFSNTIANRIPLLIIILLGIIYILYGITKKKNIRYFVMLVPCILIIFLCLLIIPRPSKYIHIPEYILMSVLLYRAIQIDYQGTGILWLVFICATLLGMVDEILQGLHPDRYFGLLDMVINSLSSLAGIVLMSGSMVTHDKDWSWASNIKEYKGHITVLSLGILNLLVIIGYLYILTGRESWKDFFPLWMLGLIVLYLIASIGLAVRNIYWSINHKSKISIAEGDVTVKIWFYIPQGILFFIHLIFLWIVLSGHEFR